MPNQEETISIFGIKKSKNEHSEFGIRGLSEPFVISNEFEGDPKRLANINFGISRIKEFYAIRFLVGEFYETPGWEVSRLLCRNYTLGVRDLSSPVFLLPKEIVYSVLSENCRLYKIEGPRSPGLQLLDVLASTTIKESETNELKKRLPLLLSWCQETGTSRSVEETEFVDVHVFRNKNEDPGYIPQGFSFKDLMTFIVSSGQLPRKEHLKDLKQKFCHERSYD